MTWFRRKPPPRPRGLPYGSYWLPKAKEWVTPPPKERVRPLTALQGAVMTRFALGQIDFWEMQDQFRAATPKKYEMPPEPLTVPRDGARRVAASSNALAENVWGSRHVGTVNDGEKVLPLEPMITASKHHTPGWDDRMSPRSRITEKQWAAFYNKPVVDDVKVRRKSLAESYAYQIRKLAKENKDHRAKAAELSEKLRLIKEMRK